MASVCTVKCFFGGRVWKPGEVCEDDTGKCPWFKAVATGAGDRPREPQPGGTNATDATNGTPVEKAPATPAKRKAKKNGDEN